VEPLLALSLSALLRRGSTKAVSFANADSAKAAEWAPPGQAVAKVCLHFRGRQFKAVRGAAADPRVSYEEKPLGAWFVPCGHRSSSPA